MAGNASSPRNRASAKSLRVERVPLDLLRRLEARAAAEGLGASDLATRILRRALGAPSRADVLREIRSRPVRDLGRRPAEIVRDERER